MGVRLLAMVGLLNLSACDRLFGLDAVGSLPTDATTHGDAVDRSCSTLMPPPFLCVDCDDGPIYYKNGNRFPLGTASGPAAYACRPPAVSGSNALWIDTGGGQYYNDVSSATPTGTRLSATFDLDLSHFTQASGVLLIELRKGSSNAVMVTLQIQTSGPPRVIIQSHCAPTDCDHYAPVFDVLPLGWIHGTLSLDTTASLARIHLDPATDLAVALTPNPFAGTPFVRFGAIDVNAGSGAPEVGLDNLVVTVQ